MTKKRVPDKPQKKQEEQQPVIGADPDNENVSKIQTTRQSRFGRPSKFLYRTEVESFQIRKSLNQIKFEELDALGRKTYFQRVFILASNIDGDKMKTYYEEMFGKLSQQTKPNYREYLDKTFKKIFKGCEEKKCTSDHLTGLCVVMDTHTLLLIGGAEDMIANFFQGLAANHDRLWQKSKVFLVNDIIGQTYFKIFYTRSAPAINTNEKFPPSTIIDENLMVVQHLKIKEKVESVVRTLSAKMNQNVDEPKEVSGDPFLLPADPYYKLLPEIQRIELVLNADKFYKSVQEFAKTYTVIPSAQDEEALFWPIQNNYTPLAIFDRSPYDVNLTFGNYGKEEKKKGEEEDADNDFQENA